MIAVLRNIINVCLCLIFSIMIIIFVVGHLLSYLNIFSLVTSRKVVCILLYYLKYYYISTLLFVLPNLTSKLFIIFAITRVQYLLHLVLIYILLTNLYFIFFSIDLTLKQLLSESFQYLSEDILEHFQYYDSPLQLEYLLISFL